MISMEVDMENLKSITEESGIFLIMKQVSFIDLPIFVINVNIHLWKDVTQEQIYPLFSSVNLHTPVRCVAILAGYNRLHQ
jgi:hypothetical protein